MVSPHQIGHLKIKPIELFGTEREPRATKQMQGAFREGPHGPRSRVAVKLDFLILYEITY